MTQHTPGPWAFAKYSKKRFGLGVRGHGAFFFLQCVDDDADNPQSRADARLIASAPELLEALKKFALKHRHTYGLDGAWDEEITMAEAAIAKATGEK
jgi:hypothetical protein